MFVAYCNRVGFEDGVGFWGGSELIDPFGASGLQGAVLRARDRDRRSADARVRRKRISSTMMRDEDIDLTINELIRVRAGSESGAMPAFARGARRFARRRRSAIAQGQELDFDGDRRANPRPTIRAPKSTRQLVHKLLVAFIRNEFHKVGVKRAVLGISGGVDSSLSAILGAHALGPENVLGIMMPYKTSSKESLEHARLAGRSRRNKDYRGRHQPADRRLLRGGKMAAP